MNPQHLPPTQDPSQHWDESAHAAPAAWQAPQALASQMRPEQQSVLPLQGPLWVTQQRLDSQPWPQQSGGPLQVDCGARHTA
jgi:hypothetical protein